MRHLFLLALLAAPVSATAETVTVFAAASLKTALDLVATGWETESGDDVVISYAGSSTLAKQIIEGAPANAFISASSDWMDALEAEGVLAGGTRRDLLGNTLVLIGTKGSPPIDLPDLPMALGESHLAMALVSAVPAGIYGKQALTTLGLWTALEPKVAQADDVRAALALVAAGEAHYGIVYATDALAETRVDTAATFAGDSHDPITYPAALIDGNATPAAASFLDYLSTSEAAQVFAAQGFKVLN